MRLKNWQVPPPPSRQITDSFSRGIVVNYGMDADSRIGRRTLTHPAEQAICNPRHGEVPHTAYGTGSAKQHTVHNLRPSHKGTQTIRTSAFVVRGKHLICVAGTYCSAVAVDYIIVFLVVVVDVGVVDRHSIGNPEHSTPKTENNTAI